jgi:hypothetical protein
MEPDDLLGGAAVEAAVAALAERNRHHLEGMDADEREEAVAHWRELAIVLTAARSTAGGDPDGGAGDGHGRATIVLEDAGGDQVTVHASFWPELEDLGGGEVAATPAQAAALQLLEQLTEPGDER